tara:strand:- start:1146 stop:1760 length:615 start_codon:yes stop_codon:yes gene_type:complete
VKNKYFINLKSASMNCLKDVHELLKNDKFIKNIFLSGGESLNIIKNNLSILNLSRNNNIYLTDERVTTNKSYLNSIKFKKIKIKKVNFKDNFNLNNLKNLNQIDNLIPKKNFISILGVGEDGHIASIFNLKEKLVLNKSMILTKRSDEDFFRISLSYEYLSKSKKIFLIFSNKKKMKQIKNKNTIIYKFLKKNNIKILNYFVKE